MPDSKEFQSIAFLWNGQNAHVGEMGKGLHDPELYAYMSTVAEDKKITVGGYRDMEDLMKNGTADEMRPTDINQLVLYTYGHALFEAWLKKAGIQVGFDIDEQAELGKIKAAGTSLGQMNALTASGAMPINKGMPLTAERGISMQRASKKSEEEGLIGKMLVVVGVFPKDIETIINEVNLTLNRDGRLTGVAAVNYNSMKQVAISGDKDAVEMAGELLEKKKGVRIVDPNIANPYHFEGFMGEALTTFDSAVKEAFPNDPKFKFPVMSNLTGKEFATTRNEFCDEIIQQIVNPTQYIQNLTKLRSDLILVFGVQDYSAKFAEATILGKEIGTNIFTIKTEKDIDDFDYEILLKQVKNIYPGHSFNIARKADEVVVVSTAALSAINPDVNKTSGKDFHLAMLEGRKGIQELDVQDIKIFKDVVELHQATLLREKLLELTSGREVTTAKLKELQAIVSNIDDKSQDLFKQIYQAGAAALIPNDLLEKKKKNGKPANFPHDWKPTQKDPFQSYGFLVAQKALEDAGVIENGVLKEFLQYTTAADMSSGMGGDLTIEQKLLEVVQKGKARPLAGEFMTNVLQNLGIGHTANQLEIRGATGSSNAACNASGIGLLNLWNAIKNPDCPTQAGLVVGAEAVSRTIMVSAFDYLMRTKGALDRVWRDLQLDPMFALRPLSIDRGGFIPGDGSGAAYIMSRRLADEIGLKYLARILAVHGTSCNPKEAGKSITNATLKGQMTCQETALKIAGKSNRDIDALCMHGTGTIDGDMNEISAIYEVFKSGVFPIVTSVKGKIGHTLGAAFIHTFVEAVEALRSEYLAGIHTTTELDPLIAASGIPVALENETLPENPTVMAEAFGFGGTNTVVIIKGVKDSL